MKSVLIAVLVLITTSGTTAQQIRKEKTPAMRTPVLYGFTVKTIDGKERSLADYKGNVLMIVNVASFCGYTSQYKDLEAVYRRYKDRGFRILGFPANNFGSQEPGTDDEIKYFCSRNYEVSFDMFSKISVKGNDQHPLYRYLTAETGFKGDVAWNFTKYLVDRKGTVIAKFPSKVIPTSAEVTGKIEAALAAE